MEMVLESEGRAGFFFEGGMMRVSVFGRSLLQASFHLQCHGADAQSREADL
jgi:hypothetical protein